MHARVKEFSYTHAFRIQIQIREHSEQIESHTANNMQEVRISYATILVNK